MIIHSGNPGSGSKRGVNLKKNSICDNSMTDTRDLLFSEPVGLAEQRADNTESPSSVLPRQHPARIHPWPVEGKFAVSCQ